MEEVFEIADRITILRDGKVVSSGLAAEYNPDRAIRDMVGRQIEEFFGHRSHEQRRVSHGGAASAENKEQLLSSATSAPPRDVLPRGDLLMSVRELSREGIFTGINFDIYRSEVLGFAGLVGARRTDVGLALFGVEPADGGQIRWEGRPVEIHSPEQALTLQIAYATEDRRQLGLTLPMSITTNISLPMLRHYLTGLGLVRRKDETATAEAYRRRLTIRAPSVQLPVEKLSGGNQQKVMLAKWLNTRPKLLILDEPTRGIDVGAKAEVHRMIGDLAASGIAIILISSDLPEVLAMSDRILVMREGRQMALFDRAEATQERILTAAMGQAAESVA
jgi:rhamnose transport system ATP-binding protein